MEGARGVGAVGRSWEWFREAPLTALGLACMSAFSVLCIPLGVGLWLLPWSLVALTAHHLRLAGVPRAGGLSYQLAVLFTAMWTLLVTSVCVLVQVSALADWLSLAGGLPAGRWVEALWRAALFVLGAALASSIAGPFAFAPAWLVENGGVARVALRESLRMGLRPGSRMWGWSTLALSVPLVGGCLLFTLLRRPGHPLDATLAFAAALAWLISLPVARGWLSARYLGLRAEEPHFAPDSHPTWAPIYLSFFAWVAVTLGPFLVALSLLRPAPLVQGALPETSDFVLRVRPRETLQSVPIPASQLVLEVAWDRVSVVAADGGGVGRLPLPADARVRGVRLGHVPEGYRAEIATDRGRYVGSFDMEGVRTDDDLTRRLRAGLSPLAQLALALSLWLGGALLRRVVATFSAPERGLPAARWVLLPALASLSLGMAALLRWGTLGGAW